QARVDVVQSAEPNVRQAVTSYSVSKSFNLPQPYDDLVPTDLGLVHTSLFSFLPSCAYFGHHRNLSFAERQHGPPHPWVRAATRATPRSPSRTLRTYGEPTWAWGFGSLLLKTTTK